MVSINTHLILKKNFFHSSKVEQAIGKITSGSTLLVGGFGLSGIPENLIRAISKRSEIKDLVIISNNAGVDDAGLGLLLKNNQVSKNLY